MGDRRYLFHCGNLYGYREKQKKGGTEALARLLSNSTVTALAMRMKIENKEMINILSRFLLHNCSTDE